MAKRLEPISQTDSKADLEKSNDIDSVMSLVTQLQQSLNSGASLMINLVELADSTDALLRSATQAEKASAHLPETLLAKPTYEELREGYVELFETARARTVHQAVVEWHRRQLLKGKSRYEELGSRTGVPWWFAGVIHGLEASFSFSSHLHNGDPLTLKTAQHPPGRPPVWNPPTDWISSAVDALQYEGFAGASDWSIPRCLYRWEQYNGFGYRKPSIAIPTPYLWSFSNHYSQGKFVRDSVYDPEAISKQCGAAVIVKALADADDISIEL